MNLNKGDIIMTLDNNGLYNGPSDDQKFWKTINDWPQDQPPSYEFCGKIDNHEKIYEEMERFDGWTHSFSDDFDEELIINIACLSGSTRDRWAAVQEKWNMRGFDAAPHGDWQYYWAVPHKEDFPTIHEFMEKNPQYNHPVIAKLWPNEVLLSHNHGTDDQYLYNVSIYEPDGSKVAVFPTGVIPFKPGDIYKMLVHKQHAVVNGGETRYHILFRGGRIKK